MEHTYRDGEEGKSCSKCLEWRPLAGFYPQLRARDGLKSICKECLKSYARSHGRARSKDPDAVDRLRRAVRERYRRLHPKAHARDRTHTLINEQEGKVCSMCDAWMPLADFWPHKKSWDGLQSHCKRCHGSFQARASYKARRKEHCAQSYQKHRAAVLERRKAWREDLLPERQIPDDDLARRLWRKTDVRCADECWEWRGRITSSGYGQISYKAGLIYTHRAAWMVTNGPVPEGKQVCHTCDNRACVNPHHLWIGDHKLNALDMEAKGRSRHPRGEMASKAKLTEPQVLEIRRRWEEDHPRYTALAREFGVTGPTIRAIVERRSWKHI